MFIDTTSNKMFYLLQKGMDASLVRQQVIADNIANVDTPGFKRMDVTFESQMRRALDSEQEERFPVKMTDQRHIDFFKPIDYREVKTRLQVEYDTNFRNDKNNVDIEREVAESVKNSLRYKAMAQRIDGKFKSLALAMQG